MSIKKSLIRLLTPRDLAGVLAVENACHSMPWTSNQFIDELKNPVASILICEIAGEIAGFISYWLIAGEMQILNLATAPKMRRRGVAELLLNRAFDECRKKKPDVGMA